MRRLMEVRHPVYALADVDGRFPRGPARQGRRMTRSSRWTRWLAEREPRERALRAEVRQAARRRDGAGPARRARLRHPGRARPARRGRAAHRGARRPRRGDRHDEHVGAASTPSALAAASRANGLRTAIDRRCRPARRRSPTRRSRGSATRSSPRGSSAATSSWRSAAAWSATSRASRRRSCAAACASCRSRRPCSRRSIPRSAARPASTRAHGKNLVGAFHQPSLVLADTALLDTLPRARDARRLCRGREVRAHRRRALLRLVRGELARRSSPAGRSATRPSRRAAAPRPRSCVRDEREEGDRALLNLGHTFAHALERVTAYDCGAPRPRRGGRDRARAGLPLLGQARALPWPGRRPRRGPSRRRSACRRGSRNVPGGCGTVDELLDAMAQDKKVKGGALTFILARGIGQSFIARGVDCRTPCAPS